MAETFVDTVGNRKLRVEEAGDPHGKPVFYLHGTPASGLLDPRWGADATRQGIRLIGYDRPAVGDSTPAPGRRVADAAADVAAIADSFGISRFAVWGISGGGPHALACAALLTPRCVAVASLASPAPPEYGPAARATRVNKKIPSNPLPTIAEQEAWKAGHRVKDLRAARSTLAGLEALAADHFTLKRGLYRLLLPRYIGREEARSLSTACALWSSSSIRWAIQHGIGGAQDDEIAIYHQPWGFELSSIRCPLLLWHGEQDQFVRVAEGRWLAARIPGVEARFPADDGHVSLAEYRIPLVHRWLLERFSDHGSPSGGRPAGARG